MKIDKSDKNEVKSSAHSKYRCQYFHQYILKLSFQAYLDPRYSLLSKNRSHYLDKGLRKKKTAGSIRRHISIGGYLLSCALTKATNTGHQRLNDSMKALILPKKLVG